MHARRNWQQIVNHFVTNLRVTPISRTNKVERLRTPQGIAIAIERRGVQFVNVWLPALAGMDLPPNAERYKPSRPRNCQLPTELQVGADVWRVKVANSNDLDATTSLLERAFDRYSNAKARISTPGSIAGAQPGAE